MNQFNYSNLSENMLTIILNDLQYQLQSTPNAYARKRLVDIIMAIKAQISTF